MGQVFGYNGVKEPFFKVLKQAEYQIRSYESYVVSQTQASMEKQQMSNAFQQLAGYIGVFGQPQNKDKQAIAMTAPVFMDDQKMEFVLPDQFKDASKTPEPTNPNVTLQTVPEQTVAVLQFTGFMNENHIISKAKELVGYLKRDNLIKTDDELVPYKFAGYNPPFTLPFFRRNEIWILIDEKLIQN